MKLKHIIHAFDNMKRTLPSGVELGFIRGQLPG